jgi:2-polyprenyl-3-methyl-5-hydroxy-6-metoxy-1,4-benzoquinol methylase
MNYKTNTRELYNDQATDWSRKEPILLSDYSARPFVMDLCEPINGLTILDLGCGEGYVGRELKKRGAERILGIDISEKMIEGAIQEQEQQGLEGLEYQAMDVLDLNTTDQYGLVIAMFLFNYLSKEQTLKTMKKAFQLLEPGGQFVFSVPHPLLPYLKKDKYPFYFTVKGGYFSGRDKLFPGEIWRRDGIAVNVQCVHKTIEDYFSCLKDAGFTTMPELHELKINEDHIKLDPDFFEPLNELPLHIAFKVEKTNG